MAKRAPLSVDAFKRKQVNYAEEDGKTFIETRQDVEPLIETARALADVPPDPDTGWRFLGIIPDVVMNRAIVEGWADDPAAWRKWLNDRDNRAFNGGRENVV